MGMMTGLADRIRRNRREWVIGCVMVVLGAAWLGSWALNARSAASEPRPSPAAMLASLQGGGIRAQFQHQLTGIDTLCTEPESRIADEVVATHDLEAKRGVSESYLSILSHVRRSIPLSAAPTRCADAFAAYAALRIGG